MRASHCFASADALSTSFHSFSLSPANSYSTWILIFPAPLLLLLLLGSFVRVGAGAVVVVVVLVLVLVLAAGAGAEATGALKSAQSASRSSFESL